MPKCGHVGHYEALLLRKRNVGSSHSGVRVVWIHYAARSHCCAPRRNLASLAKRGLEAGVAHIVPPGRNGVARFLATVGALKPLQAKANGRIHRLGVLLLPLQVCRLRIKPANAPVSVLVLHARRVVETVNLQASQLVALVDHVVDGVLLLGNVAQCLLRGHHPHVAQLVHVLLAVGAVLHALHLGGGLVERIDSKQIRVKYRAAQTLLLRIHRILHLVEEREYEVPVLLKRGPAALLRLLQHRVLVLVEIPKHNEQAVRWRHAAVQFPREWRLEDVGETGIVANPHGTLVLDPIWWAKVALIVVIPQRIALLRVNVDCNILNIECARHRDVDARVVTIGLYVPLVVERHARAEGVLSSPFFVASKGLDFAPGWRIAADVGVERAAHVRLAGVSIDFNHFYNVRVVPNPLELVDGAVLHVVVVDLSALHFVLLHEFRAAQVLGHRINGAVPRDLGVLRHNHGPVLVRAKGGVVNKLVKPDADQVLADIVGLFQDPRILHRNVRLALRITARAVWVVSVGFEVPVQLLPDCILLRRGLLVPPGRPQLAVLLRVDPTLCRSRRHHAEKGRIRHRTRSGHRLRLRFPLTNARCALGKKSNGNKHDLGAHRADGLPRAKRRIL